MSKQNLSPKNLGPQTQRAGVKRGETVGNSLEKIVKAPLFSPPSGGGGGV